MGAFNFNDIKIDMKQIGLLINTISHEFSDSTIKYIEMNKNVPEYITKSLMIPKKMFGKK